ncbi:MAG: hypothetical protein R2814_06615 [Flavobacteriaceae bacterium]
MIFWTAGGTKDGLQSSTANIMTTAALRTRLKSTFDEKPQDVLAGNKVFKY